MLKTTILLERLIFKRLKVNDSKINKFGISSSEKIAKKLRKLKSQNLSKSGTLKDKKSSKFWKLTKSRKKL